MRLHHVSSNFECLPGFSTLGTHLPSVASAWAPWADRGLASCGACHPNYVDVWCCSGVWRKAVALVERREGCDWWALHLNGFDFGNTEASCRAPRSEKPGWSSAWRVIARLACTATVKAKLSNRIAWGREPGLRGTRRVDCGGGWWCHAKFLQLEVSMDI